MSAGPSETPTPLSHYSIDMRQAALVSSQWRRRAPVLQLTSQSHVTVSLVSGSGIKATAAEIGENG